MTHKIVGTILIATAIIPSVTAQTSLDFSAGKTLYFNIIKTNSNAIDQALLRNGLSAELSVNLNRNYIPSPMYNIAVTPEALGTFENSLVFFRTIFNTLGLFWKISKTENQKLFWESRYELLVQYIYLQMSEVFFYQMPQQPIIPLNFKSTLLLGIGLNNKIIFKFSQHFAITSSFRTAFFFIGKNAYQYPLQLNILFGIRYYFNKKQASHD
ncbi:MAG: hypothetical protein GXO48_08795 [Chlorobi bacterium]|nr:hypothetical protein [Chlorobiota bacterium]